MFCIVTKAMIWKTFDRPFSFSFVIINLLYICIVTKAMIWKTFDRPFLFLLLSSIQYICIVTKFSDQKGICVCVYIYDLLPSPFHLSSLSLGISITTW